ncbi:MAG TPA: lipopolysaccharide transport periplasmic protein LptA [Nitrospirae bacterium]|nr:lipopolysaccharide transport periplasmic protein LptA [Nitrospirota bacterium]
MKLKALILLLVLLLPLSVFAKERKKLQEDEADKKTPLKVTSDQMVSDNKNNLMVFTGTVVAIKGTLTVEADEMTVWSNEEQSDISKILAIGSVVITKGDRIATGEKAVYFADTKKIILTGNPALREGKNRAIGEKVIYFFDREDMIIVGGEKKRSTVILFPKDKNSKKQDAKR